MLTLSCPAYSQNISPLDESIGNVFILSPLDGEKLKFAPVTLPGPCIQYLDTAKEVFEKSNTWYMPSSGTVRSGIASTGYLVRGLLAAELFDLCKKYGENGHK